MSSKLITKHIKANQMQSKKNCSLKWLYFVIAVKRPTDLPCVDEKDRYHCFYDIVMADACLTKVEEMWKNCRYSCNFCKCSEMITLVQKFR